MASARRASMAADAPEDVLESILVRLPVSTLLLCRCVCKSWRALISSPLFVSAHRSYNSAAGDRRKLIVRRHDPITRKIMYTLHSDDDSLTEMTEIDFPLQNPNEFSRILGYVNGLFCMLTMNDNCQLMLWNPAIRKYKILPNPSRDFTGDDRSVFGFGFDPIANDYKVVRAVYGSSPPCIEVYRLSTGSWSRIGLAGEVSTLPVLLPRQAYLNGGVHWLGCDSTIVRFDLRTETSRFISLPGDLKDKRMENVAIASWCGLLALFQLEDSMSISLWVMKECDEAFSWSRRCVIPPHAFPRRCKSIGNDGEILVEDIFGSLFWFDPTTLKTRNQTVQGLGDLNLLYMKPYLESLVLIDPWRPQGDEPSERAMTIGVSEGAESRPCTSLPNADGVEALVVPPAKRKGKEKLTESIL